MIYTSQTTRFSSYLNGANGETPYVGENGNWWIKIDGKATDLKVRARAVDGVSFSGVDEYYYATLATNIGQDGNPENPIGNNTTNPIVISIKESGSDCKEVGEGYIDGNGNLQILSSKNPREFTMWVPQIQQTNFGKKNLDDITYKYLWNIEIIKSTDASENTIATASTVELFLTHNDSRVPKNYISYYKASTTSKKPDTGLPKLSDDGNSIIPPTDSGWILDSKYTGSADESAFLFEISFVEYTEKDENGQNLYALISGPTMIGHNGSNGLPATTYKLTVNPNSWNATEKSTIDLKFNIVKYVGNTKTTTTIHSEPLGFTSPYNDSKGEKMYEYGWINFMEHSTYETIYSKGDYICKEGNLYLLKVIGKAGIYADEYFSEFDYTIKVNGEKWDGKPISNTTNFELWVDGVKVDDETVSAVSNGRFIEEVTEWYQRTKTPNETDLIENNWSETLTPPDANLPCLWNYEKSTYSDGSPAGSTKPVIIAYYTKDGRGITEIANQYLVSDETNITKDDISTHTWYNTPPATTDKAPYLWNYEIIYYDDKTSENTTPAIVGRQGNSAKDFYVSASGYALRQDKDGSISGTITLTAHPINLGTFEDSAIKWYSSDEPETACGTGRTMNISAPGTFTAKLTIGTTDWTDSATIIAIEDGATGKGAIGVVLTNPTMLFHKQSTEGSKKCTVQVYEGSNALTPGDKEVNGEFQLSGIDINGITITNNEITVTDKDEAGSYEFTIKGKTATGDEFEQSAVISWQVVDDGASNYKIQLSEEFVSVPCDSEGNVIKESNPFLGEQLQIQPILYYGDTAVDWSYDNATTANLMKVISDGLEYTIPGARGSIIIDGFTDQAERGTLTFICGQGENGEIKKEKARATFEAIKQRQGASGAPAEYVYALSDYRELKNGSFPESITISLYSRTGADSPKKYTKQVFYKYRWNISNEWVSTQSAPDTNEFSITLPDISGSPSQFQIEIYADSTHTNALDKLTITVLSDGTPGDPGMNQWVIFHDSYTGTSAQSTPPLPELSYEEIPGNKDTTNTASKGWYKVQSEASVWKSSKIGTEDTKGGWGPPIRESGVLTTKKDLLNILEKTPGEDGIYAIDGSIAINASAIRTGTIRVADSIEIDGKPQDRVLFEATITEKDENGYYSQPKLTMAGWNVNYDSITKEKFGEDGSIHLSSLGIQNTGENFGNLNTEDFWMLGIGSNFGVTKAGKIYAQDARISGHIEATSGKIGNLFINDDGSLNLGELSTRENLIKQSGVKKEIYEATMLSFSYDLSTTLQADKDYTFSMQVCRDNTDFTQVYVYSNSGVNASILCTIDLTKIPTDVNYTCGVTFKTTATNVNKITIIPSYKAVKGQHHTINWVKLEEGVNATAWIAAPADVADAETAANNAVNAVNNKMDPAVASTYSWYFSPFNGVTMHKGSSVSGGTLVMQLDDKGLYINGNGVFSGTITATGGNIGGCEITDGKLSVPAARISGTLSASQINTPDLFTSEVKISGGLTAFLSEGTDAIYGKSYQHISLRQGSLEWYINTSEDGNSTARKVTLAPPPCSRAKIPTKYGGYGTDLNSRYLPMLFTIRTYQNRAAEDFYVYMIGEYDNSGDTTWGYLCFVSSRFYKEFVPLDTI